MALRPVPPIRVADAEMQPLPLQSLTEAQLRTRAFIPEFIKMHSQSFQNLIKNGSLRTRGPLWVFQDVAQGDFFAHVGALGLPLGARRVPLGSTLGFFGSPRSHLGLFGSPRVSFWSFFGTFWCHLGDLGQPAEIAIFL